ncbi:hypothetical protein PY479_16080 [Shewanella sp. A32]|uniref:hypothetical protein n=1 Tax=Shewanella sp. A32 TaxID=3031327 RepID=UPI0023B959FE|nr:hypothetical protein [Shewanella sp. A32]MDF0535788.1 hypothetical protein [Shewanella sp. A32]
MSQWDDKFAEHAIHTNINNLNERLNNNALITEDLNIIDILDKIKQAISYSEVCLNNIIPALVNFANLDKANEYLNIISNELNHYISNKNIAHLNNTQSHVTNYISQINALPVSKEKISKESFTNSLVEFKKLAENSLIDLRNKKDELSNSISELKSESGKQLSRIKNLESDISKNNDINNISLDKLNNEIEAIKSNFLNDMNSELKIFEQNYNNYSKHFENQLTDALETNKLKIDAIISENNEKYSKQLEGQKSQAKEVLDKLLENKKDASNLLQIIGNIGITGNYQNIANSNKVAADRWRKIALSLMIIMVAIIFLTIFITATNGFDWKLALFRVGAAFILNSCSEV